MADPAVVLDPAVLDPARRDALATVLAHPSLIRPGSTLPGDAAEHGWSLADLQGRLCELSPGPQPAVLSAAVWLVRQAQLAGEPVAWVATGPDLVHAPDVAAGGVDLAALPVVRAADAMQAGRAADLLLRSGAFGLVMLDLGRGARLAPAMQSRLMQLALKHDSAVVCLTATPAGQPSLGSLVSLRASVSRHPVAPGRSVCRVASLKDKRRGPGWCWQGVWRGADGLA